MCNLASVILALGKEDEAERMYKISLAIKEKHSGLDAMERADTMSDLAALYQAQGRLSEAETMLTEALRINQLLLGQESPAVEELMNRMAGLYPPPLSPIPDCGA
jgi:tetratricopeptide (TPR) repeat protein